MVPLAVAHIGVGFLVAALVISFGGATGPALNPARDLMPRLLHHILPTTVLGEHKGDSKWWYGLGSSCSSNLSRSFSYSFVQVPLPLINTKNLKLVLQIFYA